MIIAESVMISLNLEAYGINPCSSTAYVREDKKGFSVYLEADEELLPKPVRIGSTKKDYDWRIFGGILCQIKEGWIGVESYPRVDVSGETGIRAEVLVLCWGCPEANTDLIDWLLEQSDGSLDYLHINLGSLLNEDNLQFLAELVELIGETSQDADLFDLVNQHGSLNKLYNYLEQEKEDADQFETDGQKKIIEPFLQRISEILVIYGNHRRPHPMAQSKSMLLESWLIQYILDNSDFPSGEHNVKVRDRGGIKELGVIDFSTK